jgi:hypothetical protein
MALKCSAGIVFWRALFYWHWYLPANFPNQTKTIENMKKLLLLMLPVLVALTSCDNYGKKLAVGESEIFYKGEGLSEKDAKALGDFLVDHELFDKKRKSSAQLIKEGNKYIVRLVMASKEVDPAVRLNIWKLQTDLSNDVFDGAEAHFALADDRFENEEILEPTSVVKLGMASVIYDSKSFKKDEAQKLVDFFKEQGLFTSDKAADVLLRTEEGSPIIRVIVDKAYLEENKETVMPVFGYWQYLLQNNIEPYKEAKMWLTTTTYEDYKKIPKLSAEEVAALEGAPSGTENTSVTETVPPAE